MIVGGNQIDTKSGFTFVDLFAGIGGFRLGLEAAGGKAIFTNEWDKYAAETYRAWFHEREISTEDIRNLNPKTDIPSHDVLSAGFPCQPFSIAGVSKKKSLGRPHGFSDLQQGNLFFQVCDVIDAKRPKVVLLENVKNLISHDEGKTWKIIVEALTVLGYKVNFRVINAAGWVPQNRRRVFIVALNKKHFNKQIIDSFQFPEEPTDKPKLSSILEVKVPDKKYMLTDNLWNYLKIYADRHKARGNGFGYKLYGPEDTAGTLSARYYKDGAEILIKQDGWKNPRRLLPIEAGRLMGFSNELAKLRGFTRGFPQIVSDMQSYKQFGNSVCPYVVIEIAKEISRVLALRRPLRRKEVSKKIGARS
jgi:DNA (cytosine-5)-methyltransferase 1